MIVNILIIEDDLLTGKILCEMILNNFENGSTVVLVDSLSKAYVEVNNFKFDLIVLDLFLPNGKGLETIEKLLSNLSEPKPPILSITGIGSVSDEVESVLKGSQEFLHKPFSCTEFIKAIRLTLARGMVRPLFEPIKESIENIKQTLEKVKSR